MRTLCATVGIALLSMQGMMGCQSEPARRPVQSGTKPPDGNGADGTCKKTPDAAECTTQKTKAQIEAERAAAQEAANVQLAQDCKANKYTDPKCVKPKAGKEDDPECMKANYDTDDCREPKAAAGDPKVPVPAKPIDPVSSAPSVVDAKKPVPLTANTLALLIPAGTALGKPTCVFMKGDKLNVSSSKQLDVNNAQSLIEFDKTDKCADITTGTILRSNWDGWAPAAAAAAPVPAK